jgi:predicted NAD-dependent protein-ADP-ribosyltransferase YbiA (DUF1768 family)
MVSSKIDESINYKENRSIEEEDRGNSSIVYEMEIEDIPIQFILGKQKYTYSNKNILYYPIYLVYEGQIQSQIGVFELKSNEAINILDSDGDVDLNELDDPLIYSFITKNFLERITKSTQSKPVDHAEPDTLSEEGSENNSISMEIEDLDEDSEEDESDPTSLKIPKTVLSEQTKHLEEQTRDGAFEIDTNHKQPALLSEETDAMDREIKLDYKEDAKQPWIQKYMRNNNYGIIEVESNGDCFFASIREAFRQIGYKTTVAKLRAILAKELPERIFADQLELYNGFQGNIQEIERRMEQIKKENAEYKKRVKRASASEREEILENANRLKEEYKEKQKEKQETEMAQNTYVGYMKNIKTLDQYREYVQTPSFWADAWAISTLERILNIKMIILSEMAYDEDAFHSVLNCGEPNVKLQDRGIFNPDFYIMVTYSGNHYRLVTYKSKGILTFREIPYGIKKLVVNKCLERNSGVFYLIEDFRNFKQELGIDPDTGNPSKDDDNENTDSNRDAELYDDDVTFMFHQHSEISAKPGKGSGESIPISKIPDFKELAKIKIWRRMLDDTWSDIKIDIDNRKWTSVEHYMQGSKYKNGFPDFYHQFSLDSESEISTNIDYAKAAGGETGKLKQKKDSGKSKEIVLRAKHIHPDSNYDAIESRKVALDAKFTQNPDMEAVLLNTGHAKLVHFSRGPLGNKEDIPLMQMRQTLSSKTRDNI